MIKFYQYPNCTTCKKAAKFLQDYGVSFEPIDIVQHTPTKNEFKEILEVTDIDINKLFNTHGAKYRELGLKDKLKDLTSWKLNSQGAYSTTASICFSVLFLKDTFTI